jgi:hypothetical protein
MSWMDIEFDSLYVYHPNMESHIALHGVVNKGEEVFLGDGDPSTFESRHTYHVDDHLRDSHGR